MTGALRLPNCNVPPGAAAALDNEPANCSACKGRKQWQKGKSRPATVAVTAPDLNPAVMFIVRLLATASVTDDRIVAAIRASPQDSLGAPFVPIDFDLARRDGKWDK